MRLYFHKIGSYMHVRFVSVHSHTAIDLAFRGLCMRPTVCGLGSLLPLISTRWALFASRAEHAVLMQGSSVIRSSRHSLKAHARLTPPAACTLPHLGGVWATRRLSGR